MLTPPSMADAPRAPVGCGQAGTHPPSWVRDFDEVFVRMLLKQAQASQAVDEGPAGSGGYRELADDHLARVVASGGGIGLGCQLWSSLQGKGAYRRAGAEA
jgi:Rod binding domain-containing protein